jgi:hypothetical protein
VPADEWPGALDAITAHRVAGHAVRAVVEGSLLLTTEQREQLLDRHEQQLALDLRVEAMLLDCSEVLERVGVPTRLLKGPSVAHRFYADPALRSFGDGDVLVRGADMERAIAALSREGFVRRFGAPRRFFDRRYVKAVTLIRADGLELDLHRSIAEGPFGVLIDADEVFAAATEHVSIGGRSLACLPSELALVHACVHAALGDVHPRPVALRDIVQMLHHGVREEAAIDYFERFQSGIVAQRAIHLVDRALGVELTGPLAGWARSFFPRQIDEARLRAYARAEKRYVAQAASTFWALPSLRQRVGFAAALAFPTREYIRGREGTYARRLARSTTTVLRWRPR